MSQSDTNNRARQKDQSSVTSELHSTRVRLYGKNISVFVLLITLTVPAIGAGVAVAQMTPGWQSSVIGFVADGYSTFVEPYLISIDGVYGAVLSVVLLLSGILRAVSGAIASSN